MTDNPLPEDQPQTLVEHLIELRDRLLRAMLAVLIIFLGIFYFSREIYALVALPLTNALPEGTSMIATEVAAPFLVPFKLSLYVSILIAMPVILHQIWAFIAPGLYKHEKKLAIPLLISSVFLFYLGAAFAYFVVFPLIFAFFTAIAPEGVAIATDIGRYLDFVMKLFIAFGLAFEMPIAIVLLVKAGVTTVASLKEKRPYIIVGCFVVGMLLTPPDIISQTLLALPMWILFEIGLFFAKWVKPEEKKESLISEN